MQAPGGGKGKRGKKAGLLDRRTSLKRFKKSVEREDGIMDTTLMIRLASGALFLIVLVVLVQRRRTRVK
jgi:hypothetical protein